MDTTVWVDLLRQQQQTTATRQLRQLRRLLDRSEVAIAPGATAPTSTS